MWNDTSYGRARSRTGSRQGCPKLAHFAGAMTVALSASSCSDEAPPTVASSVTTSPVPTSSVPTTSVAASSVHTTDLASTAAPTHTVAAATPTTDAPPSQQHTTSSVSVTAGELTIGFDDVTVTVPSTWAVTDTATIGTEFSMTAPVCTSAEVIDQPAAADSSATLQRAALQLCATAIDDRHSLEAWLSGRGTSRFERTTYGDCQVLEVDDAAERRLAYLQTQTRRVEIASSVTTTPELAEQRRDEVEHALDDMVCEP